ncbi:hypothetical protein NECID01_1539 [Nematocida sp. AWRm77]|nr:hypothetical protein NECID01_1539 [Nematocida sp. AWRm77]
MYISTQSKESAPVEEMTAEQMKKALQEISPSTAGKISKEELFKMITRSGEKFSITDANQVLAFIPKENEWIDIETLCKILFPETQ